MKLKYTILFIFFIYTSLYGITLSESKLNQLSKNPTWLKLIHYKNKKNEIISNTFYLSKDKNPKEELISTLNAYKNFDNYNKNNNHPQCKFPARYYWLSQQLDLKRYNTIEPFCQNLKKWKALNNTTSISIILVSGYLGNPASTFGHSFIKLNSKENLDSDLFDLSINYGALVPDNEPIIKYIFKGIFGGYESGFSDKYFYTQDLIYSHNEFRDMWEYKLNLNKYQKKLILFHLWEIIAKKFNYYFLDKNCAYRVSEIYELISNKKIITNSKVWYAPIQTFTKLEELNKNETVIEKIRYIPSFEKKIYKRFNLLSNREKEITLSLIKNKYKDIDLKLDYIDLASKINILDFLLEFEKYQTIKEPNRDQKYKKILLIKRFKLPPSKKKSLFIKHKDSPAKGNKPTIISIGNNYLNNFGYYPSINFSTFAIESIGNNSLDYDELIVGKTSIGYKDNKVFLNNLNLIKIQKLKTINLPWQKNFMPSWNLNVGAKTIYNQKRKTDFFGDFGIGKAYKFNNMIFYSFLNTSFHSNFPYIKVKPNFNINFDMLDTKNLISAGISINPYNNDSNEFFKFKSQYNISQKLSFELNFEKNVYEKSYLNLKFFF